VPKAWGDFAPSAKSVLAPGSNRTDLALSKGAKIAIIVSAIVVGVILLVGIAEISAPHPPLCGLAAGEPTVRRTLEL
jgi:hypothetical protein